MADSESDLTARIPTFVRPALRRSLLASTSGVAALEFAIVGPVFIFMMIGMMCFGLYYTYIHEVEELAGAAARASIAGLNAAERTSLARQYVANAAANAPFLHAADLTVSTATTGTPATVFAVTVTYNLRSTPIPVLASLVSTSATSITRTCSVQFGGY